MISSVSSPVWPQEPIAFIMHRFCSYLNLVHDYSVHADSLQGLPKPYIPLADTNTNSPTPEKVAAQSSGNKTSELTKLLVTSRPLHISFNREPTWLCTDAHAIQSICSMFSSIQAAIITLVSTTFLLRSEWVALDTKRSGQPA